MRIKPAYRPSLEGLEGRWVPATIRLVGGFAGVVAYVVGALLKTVTG